jgi:hypothetical protein
VKPKAKPNKPDAANPANALLFRAKRQWRGVADPGRSAVMNALTAALVSPKEFG